MALLLCIAQLRYAVLSCLAGNWPQLAVAENYLEQILVLQTLAVGQVADFVVLFLEQVRWFSVALGLVQQALVQPIVVSNQQPTQVH